MHINTVNLKISFLFQFFLQRGILDLGFISVKGFLKTLKKYITIIFYGEKQ